MRLKYYKCGSWTRFHYVVAYYATPKTMKTHTQTELYVHACAPMSAFRYYVYVCCCATSSPKATEKEQQFHPYMHTLVKRISIQSKTIKFCVIVGSIFFLRRESSKVRVVYMWSRSLRIHTERFSCRSKYKKRFNSSQQHRSVCSVVKFKSNKTSNIFLDKKIEKWIVLLWLLYSPHWHSQVSFWNKIFVSVNFFWK